MGLIIPTYPLYNGAAEVACYVNLRRLQQTKVETEVLDASGAVILEEYYTLQGLATFKNDDLYVDSLVLKLKSEDIFLDDWASMYTALKANLDARDIEWIDDYKSD